MKLDEYLRRQKRGSLAKLAAILGAHAPDVSRWAQGTRPVPEKAAVAIERATGGEVMRWDLRTADWFEIWPELIGSPGAPLCGPSRVTSRDDACEVAA